MEMNKVLIDLKNYRQGNGKEVENVRLQELNDAIFKDCYPYYRKYGMNEKMVSKKDFADMILLKMYEKADKFDESYEAGYKGWLKIMAREVFKDYDPNRNKNNATTGYEDYERVEIINKKLSDAINPNPEERTTSSETLEAIANAIKALPDNYRQAWTYEMMGYSREETAKAMNTTKNNVYRYINRGKEKLQESLKDELEI